MDFDEELNDIIYNNTSDSGNESSAEENDENDDNDGLSVALDVEPMGSHHKDRMDIDEEFPFEVLTTEKIVEHMIDSIREVNTIVQVFNYILLFLIHIFFRTLFFFFYH
jgi:ariadne-1